MSGLEKEHGGFVANGRIMARTCCKRSRKRSKDETTKAWKPGSSLQELGLHMLFYTR